MHIDWWTLSLQVVNFLILVWLLWRFLFRPVKDVIARRKALADAASGKLEQSRREVEEEKRRYEEDRRALADEQRRRERELHEELAEERGKALAQAREEAEKIKRNARARIAEERRATLEALHDEIVELAADMAAHLLEQTSPETYSNLLLARIGERLENLADDERRRIGADLAAEDAVIGVATATVLDETMQRQWSDRLHRLLSSSVPVQFETDSSLVAGAVLKLPHSIIEFNWMDQLQAARTALAQ